MEIEEKHHESRTLMKVTGSEEMLRHPYFAEFDSRREGGWRLGFFYQSKGEGERREGGWRLGLKK